MSGPKTCPQAVDAGGVVLPAALAARLVARKDGAAKMLLQNGVTPSLRLPSDVSPTPPIKPIWAPMDSLAASD